MNTSTRNTVIALALFAASGVTFAQQGDMHKGMDMGNMKMEDSKPTATSLASGEVKAIDTKGKTVTLKHGRIQSKTVQMGPMTMTFPVQSPDMLEHVKKGDKVQFTVENVNDVATVTVLKPQKQ